MSGDSSPHTYLIASSSSTYLVVGPDQEQDALRVFLPVLLFVLGPPAAIDRIWVISATCFGRRPCPSRASNCARSDDWAPLNAGGASARWLIGAHSLPQELPHCAISPSSHYIDHIPSPFPHPNEANYDRPNSSVPQALDHGNHHIGDCRYFTLLPPRRCRLAASREPATTTLKPRAWSSFCRLQSISMRRTYGWAHRWELEDAPRTAGFGKLLIDLSLHMRVRSW